MGAKAAFIAWLASEYDWLGDKMWSTKVSTARGSLGLLFCEWSMTLGKWRPAARQGVIRGGGVYTKPTRVVLLCLLLGLTKPGSRSDQSQRLRCSVLFWADGRPVTNTDPSESYDCSRANVVSAIHAISIWVCPLRSMVWWRLQRILLFTWRVANDFANRLCDEIQWICGPYSLIWVIVFDLWVLLAWGS